MGSPAVLAQSAPKPLLDSCSTATCLYACVCARVCVCVCVSVWYPFLFPGWGFPFLNIGLSNVCVETCIECPTCCSDVLLVPNDAGVAGLKKKWCVRTRRRTVRHIDVLYKKPQHMQITTATMARTVHSPLQVARSCVCVFVVCVCVCVFALLRLNAYLCLF